LTSTVSSPKAETLPGLGGTRTAGSPRTSTSRQRTGAAEGGEREVADVESALDGDLAQGVRLVPGRDLQDARGARLRREPELAGELADAGPRGLDVERDLAAEQVRRDPAEEDVSVGDRDLGAALGVAEGPRVGARRPRPDLEGALG
jgi:hypothetical protein